MDRRLRRHCVKKIALILSALSVPLAPAAISQTVTDEAFSSSRHAVEASPPPTFFPHNWIRGYTEFAVAPSHNEPDLGRCMFPQPSTAGGAASQCTAYARYHFSGSIEMQPPRATLRAPSLLVLRAKLHLRVGTTSGTHPRT